MKFSYKRFLKNLITVGLCILIFIFTCIFIALLIFRVGNTAVLLENTDISGILYDTEIAYYMESQLNGLPFNNSYITLYEIEVFIKSEAVSNEIAGIAKRYTRELSAGNLDYHITAGDVFVLSQNLSPELFDLFGHQMTDADYRLFVRTLDDILDFRGLTIKGILEDLKISTATARLLLSPYPVWAAGILWILNILILCLFHKDNPEKTLLSAGIPVLVSGFIFLTAGVIPRFYPELISGTLGRFTGAAGGILLLAFRYGIVFSAAGVFSVTARIILGCRRQIQKSVLKSLQ